MQRFLTWIPLFFLLVTTLAGADERSVILERDQHQSVRTEEAMVVAGEELAARVGRDILRQGGNAVDSTVATALTLAVTLPRAGNLGGGGFALVRLSDGEVVALDFREKAPAALHPDYYKAQDKSSTLGPTAVGVPGTVAGLWEMHQKYGSLPWEQLVAPAARLAQEGFPVTPWFHDGLQSTAEKFRQFPSSAKIFLPEGKPPEVGSVFRQLDLAQTLQRLAQQGPKDFYEGETAGKIARAVQAGGGDLTEQDLDSYQPVWREPVEGQFRGYTIHSMPPPSSGGIHLIQMLKLMESYPQEPTFHNSARDIHLLAEAMRLAYADRAVYLGDPDFVKIPQDRLLSDAYLNKRRDRISQERAGDSKALAPELFQQAPPESPDTTHLSSVDKDGMAVSLTYTLNFSYGSGFVAEGTGVLLNNELDDFTVIPGEPNAFGLLGSKANQVEGGKRPLSSMTPTIVTKDGRFVATVGAPGGSRIINGVFQWILNHVGYGFNPQTSSALPRVHHQWYPDQLFYEIGISHDSRELLAEKGHALHPIYAVAHVLAIAKHPEGYLEAGLDPRRPAFATGY